MSTFDPRASRAASPVGRLLAPLAIIGVFLLLVFAVAAGELSARLAVKFAGRGKVPTWGRPTFDAVRRGGPRAMVGARGPIGLFYGLWIACGLVLLAVVVFVGVVVARRRRRGDTATGTGMASGRQLAGITPRDSRHAAARLRPGVELRTAADYGLPLGVTVSDRVPLTLGWEDCALCIAGPRVGKTTSLCVPHILVAPGAVVATSNKPDLHDATRGIRAERGYVWSFDPQHVTRGESGGWWWDALAAVTSIGAARKLVGHFVAATTAADAKRDAFFDTEGEALAAQYILAAAASGGDLLHVHAWLADEHDETPADLLEAFGYSTAAIGVRGTLATAEKQRQGVFGTARRLLRVLEDDNYAALVTPPLRMRFRIERRADGSPDVQSTRETRGVGDPSRVLFDAARFVVSTDTLFLLSLEGPDSAAALTTALAAAVFDAGMAAAATQPAGRLATPLVFVLDEAANVCRIRELPNLYSHFGSRGMVVVTVLQSYSQGVEVWGERGMRKLWSAANVRWYGGGVAEQQFLSELSSLIGDREVRYWTNSYTPGRSGGMASSEARAREPIMSVADLAALPRGRAVVLSSGNRATLVRPIPWMAGPQAAQVRASLATFESPGAASAREAGTAVATDEIATTDKVGVTADAAGL